MLDSDLDPVSKSNPGLFILTEFETNKIDFEPKSSPLFRNGSEPESENIQKPLPEKKREREIKQNSLKPNMLKQ